MTTNTMEVKARRLVDDDRVTVTYLSPHGKVMGGMVRGDSNLYEVVVDPAGSWCQCQWSEYHRGSTCSHALALVMEVAELVAEPEPNLWAGVVASE